MAQAKIDLSRTQIFSPIDGIVKEIAVSEGQTVEAGATLFVVAPPEA